MTLESSSGVHGPLMQFGLPFFFSPLDCLLFPSFPDPFCFDVEDPPFFFLLLLDFLFAWALDDELEALLLLVLEERPALPRADGGVNAF